MSLTKIKSALVSAFVSGNFFTKANTEFENMSFTPGAAPWARLTFVPAQPVVATLGHGGADRVDGFFQIDLNFPLNTGDAGASAKFEEIKNTFTAGARFTYSGQQVVISSCGRSQGRIVAGFFRVVVTVNFYGHVNR